MRDLIAFPLALAVVWALERAFRWWFFLGHEDVRRDMETLERWESKRSAVVSSEEK